MNYAPAAAAAEKGFGTEEVVKKTQGRRGTKKPPP